MIIPHSSQPTIVALNSPHSCHTWIEINESAIHSNIAYYKQLIGAHNKLALVIKGNGYGHGLLTMGALCQKNDAVDMLCVAHYEEALQLLQSGVYKPILVLGYAFIPPLSPVSPTMHFMVDTLEYATYLNQIGKAHSLQIAVHLKIDTGLSRLGIAPEHVFSFVQQLHKLSYLTIVGIFSHFIASDSNRELSKQQIKIFSAVAENSAFEYMHMSNTGSLATLQYASLYNTFRVGLGIYGFGNAHVQPALTWKTTIIALKTIPAHSYVSYACTYKTTRTTHIALLPVGYSDGYQLRFSNKTSVLINGTAAPVIGRVGMNMTIVDVTETTAHKGDEVILIGPVSPVTLTDIAQKADIYNVREILTGIHPLIIKIIK